jgi:hypothetical protein
LCMMLVLGCHWHSCEDQDKTENESEVLHYPTPWFTLFVDLSDLPTVRLLLD